MAGNGHNSAWTLRGGEQRSESSWAASSRHLRLHTLQPLLPFPNIKRDGLCGRQFFGGICVVLGRQRYSTPCVSMLRIWQVAVKELYVFTEFMRLLGIQLFSIKSYFYCEIFLRLALEGAKQRQPRHRLQHLREATYQERSGQAPAWEQEDETSWSSPRPRSWSSRCHEALRSALQADVQQTDLSRPCWEFCSRLVSSRDDVGGRSPTGGCSRFSGLVEVLGLGEGTESGPWPIPGPR